MRLPIRIALATAVVGAITLTDAGLASAATHARTPSAGQSAQVKKKAADHGTLTSFTPTVPNPTTATRAQLDAAAPAAKRRSLTSDSSTGGSISRDEVIERAKTWTDAGVPYSMNKYRTDANGTYRTDCSGFVSMAWHLASSSANNYGETTGTLLDFTSSISKDSLKPGDILLNPDAGASGHVAIFGGWANADHTKYEAYEESGGEPNGYAKHSTVPYPYWPGHGTFSPRRYDKIVDNSSANAMSPLVNVGDINGNGVSDLLARRKDGHALVYWGKGDGTYTDPTDLGGGWDAYDSITGVGDLKKNGMSDLLVRRKSDGHALVYWGKGDGGFTDPTDLGGGWDAYDSITGIGDINKNGVPDLMVRRKSDGHALVYWGKGDGGFTDPTDLGGGWDAYDVITNAGDLNGNGVPDLLVRRKSDGHALVYWGKGDGGYTNPTDLGGGWDAYDAITGVGDINKDGVPDLMVRRKSDGHALVYWGKGDGGYTNPTDLGGGWDNYS
ncbi:FG-GAP-like repeat-containing protein [Streptomyces blastmyceticus]|uniref:NlpC/P60 domain-containing protein n=1 Tax=Streptomyces blastmyceticus TaxID=68180 RepID=A0ABN0WXH2_9ACTN